MRVKNFKIIVMAVFICNVLIAGITQAADLEPGKELIAAAIKNKSDLFNVGKNPVFYTQPQQAAKSLQTVVVFYDYNCKFSRDLMQLLKLEIDKKLYKIIFKPVGITSDNSKAVAELALAAFNLKPESFIALHNELSSLTYGLPFTDNNLQNIVTKVGLKYEDLKAAIDGQSLGNQVLQNQIVYDAIRFPGVPSIILAKLDNNNNILNDKIFFIAGTDKNLLEYNLYRISI